MDMELNVGRRTVKSDLYTRFRRIADAEKKLLNAEKKYAEATAEKKNSVEKRVNSRRRNLVVYQNNFDKYYNNFIAKYVDLDTIKDLTVSILKNDDSIIQEFDTLLISLFNDMGTKALEKQWKRDLPLRRTDAADRINASCVDDCTRLKVPGETHIHKCVHMKKMNTNTFCREQCIPKYPDISKPGICQEAPGMQKKREQKNISSIFIKTTWDNYINMSLKQGYSEIMEIIVNDGITIHNIQDLFDYLKIIRVIIFAFTLDYYILGRMNRDFISNNVIIYAGNAHIRNYISIFKEHYGYREVYDTHTPSESGIIDYNKLELFAHF